jgi:hypothetical protein
VSMVGKILCKREYIGRAGLIPVPAVQVRDERIVAEQQAEFLACAAVLQGR